MTRALLLIAALVLFGVFIVRDGIQRFADDTAPTWRHHTPNGEGRVSGLGMSVETAVVKEIVPPRSATERPPPGTIVVLVEVPHRVLERAKRSVIATCELRLRDGHERRWSTDPMVSGWVAAWGRSARGEPGCGGSYAKPAKIGERVLVYGGFLVPESVPLSTLRVELWMSGSRDGRFTPRRNRVEVVRVPGPSRGG